MSNFFAMHCLDAVAKQITNSNSIVSYVIANDFCMDDFLTGFSIIKEASNLQIEIYRTLLTVGFSLRKYTTNSNELLETLNPTIIQQATYVQFRSHKSILY